MKFSYPIHPRYVECGSALTTEIEGPMYRIEIAVQAIDVRGGPADGQRYQHHITVPAAHGAEVLQYAIEAMLRDIVTGFGDVNSPGRNPKAEVKP